MSGDSLEDTEAVANVVDDREKYERVENLTSDEVRQLSDRYQALVDMVELVITVNNFYFDY